MRKLVGFSLALGLVLIALFFAQRFLRTPEPEREKPTFTPKSVRTTMNITSPSFSNNQQIPQKYTCDGVNVSPVLAFSNLPQGAKSLVLIVDDPDAPSKTWVHWVVYNIDPSVAQVQENAVPKNGVLGMTDFGKPGYAGPCPPSGTHRYFFKLFALDTVLDLPSNADKKAVENAMKGHILTTAELVGLYERRG